jgi:hypothetical protein
MQHLFFKFGWPWPAPTSLDLSWRLLLVPQQIFHGVNLTFLRVTAGLPVSRNCHPGVELQY